jgi:hypothetical protein
MIISRFPGGGGAKLKYAEGTTADYPNDVATLVVTGLAFRPYIVIWMQNGMAYSSYDLAMAAAYTVESTVYGMYVYTVSGNNDLYMRAFTPVFTDSGFTLPAGFQNYLGQTDPIKFHAGKWRAWGF